MGVYAPIALGIGGMIAQQDANRKAQNAADAARRSSDRLIERQVQWYDNLYNVAQRAEKDGQFDPTKQIAQLENDTARYEARDAGNTAGAMRTAGYRPGDSELNRNLENVKLKYRASLDQMRSQARRQALFDMIGAYSAANPNALNTGIASAQNQQQMAQSQMTNPAALFTAIAPFVNPSKSGGGSGGFSMQPRLQSAANSAYAGVNVNPGYGPYGSA